MSRPAWVRRMACGTLREVRRRYGRNVSLELFMCQGKWMLVVFEILAENMPERGLLAVSERCKPSLGAYRKLHYALRAKVAAEDNSFDPQTPWQRERVWEVT